VGIPDAGPADIGPDAGIPDAGPPDVGTPDVAAPGADTRAAGPAGRAGARRASSRADPARRAACDVLCAVAARGAYANLLLPAMLRERGLTGRDAALATELTYGTLRGRGTYDAILAVCADRDLSKIDAPVLEVLRLGAHQLLDTRIKTHAAVATSVDLARYVAGQRPAGFVNAVLRRVAQRDLESWIQIAAPSRADDLVGHLAVRYSHPRWIVTALAEALGEDPADGLSETQEALVADGVRPAVTLCAVPGLADQAELVTDGAQAARWSPFGVYLQEGDPATVAAVAQRRAGVQDEASQLAALAVARAELPGAGAGTSDSRWLDLCAGPGGKARLLAGLAAGRGARLLAADVRIHRARLVRASIGRPGTASAVVADGTAPAWRQAAFDRVLADVPCSGLGALRRRPEARWRRTPQDVSDLGGLQRRLLAAAVDAARPGGIVAYVTCSPHLAETRDVVGDLLSARGDIRVLDAPAVLAEVPGLRCPDRHGTDAIFLALLQRHGSH